MGRRFWTLKISVLLLMFSLTACEFTNPQGDDIGAPDLTEETEFSAKLSVSMVGPEASEDYQNGSIFPDDRNDWHTLEFCVGGVELVREDGSFFRFPEVEGKTAESQRHWGQRMGDIDVPSGKYTHARLTIAPGCVYDEAYPALDLALIYSFADRPDAVSYDPSMAEQIVFKTSFTVVLGLDLDISSDNQDVVLPVYRIYEYLFSNYGLTESELVYGLTNQVL